MLWQIRDGKVIPAVGSTFYREWFNLIINGSKECPTLPYGDPAPYLPVYKLEPKRILRSGNATIVFWNDNTKTIVKCSPDEIDNTYNAFTAALAIKTFGSNSAVRRLVKRKTVWQTLKEKVKKDADGR